MSSLHQVFNIWIDCNLSLAKQRAEDTVFVTLLSWDAGNNIGGKRLNILDLMELLELHLLKLVVVMVVNSETWSLG